ncbi:protein kinase, partial [Streptomyces sp. UH6]|uniref:protein kinase domain-containing protein n=1 Tax=Streptomyces sp. UH6 TaxID=2748379 RepID=UPI0015D51CD9
MSHTDPTDFVPSDENGFSRAHEFEARGVTATVPPELADRFALLRVIQPAARVSQAMVLRVRDLTGPTPDLPLVLKWYHHRHAPQPEVARVMREEGPHLERLLEQGVTGGNPYHLCRSHGETHLGDHRRAHPDGMPADRLTGLVRQLHAAVAHLHEHEIVHRDITPDNIVVQSHGDAPEIVLVDLGAAVFRPGLRRHVDWRGKPLYLAPEAGARRQTVSEAGDWWSVGMVVAELHLGRPILDEREDEAVLQAVATRDPEVDRIEDRRIRLLCAGLLTRNPEHRWGADEVEEWLDGGSPPTAPRDTGAARRAAPEPEIRPFDFVNKQFTVREPLAMALDLYHTNAHQMLADPQRRAELCDWLRQFAPEGNAAGSGGGEPARLCEQLREEPTPEVFTRLVNWLGPELEASCWGWPLTVRGIRDLGARVAGGDGGALQLVEHLRRFPGVLTELAHRPAGEGLAEVAAHWQALGAEWQHLVRELLALPDVRRLRGVRQTLRRTAAVDMLLLQLAREPERMEAQLTQEAVRFESGLPPGGEVPWFSGLLRPTDDDTNRRLRLVAARLLTPLASRDADERHRRMLLDEAERRFREDQDGAIAVLQRLDLLPTLGWALLGALMVTFPYSFLIGLADVLGRASQEEVVTAWIWSLALTPPVFAAEMFTAVWIRPPAYHPDHSLAGPLIRNAERPARLALSGRMALLVGSLVLVAVAFLVWATLARLPWLWPLASTAAVVVWSVVRCVRWSL